MSEQLITITVPTKNILDEVRSQCYYFGESKKTSDKTLDIGLKVQMSSDDDAQVLAFLKDAVFNVTGFISSILGDTTCASTYEDLTDMVFTINASNFPNSKAGNLENSIISYLVNYILSEWFAMVDTSDAQVYYDKTLACENNIKSCSRLRQSPVRRTSRFL